MAEHPIQGLMGVTIEKIRDMVNAETIIGDPIHVDDTTIIPVSRVTFGFVSGGSDVGPSSNKQMFGGGSGAGVSVRPVAFLVVSNGNVRTVQLVEKVSAVDNVIASLPELVDVGKNNAITKANEKLKAWPEWNKTSIMERQSMLYKLSEEIWMSDAIWNPKKSA